MERRLRQRFHGPLSATSVTRYENPGTSSSGLAPPGAPHLSEQHHQPASHAWNTPEHPHSRTPCSPWEQIYLQVQSSEPPKHFSSLSPSPSLRPPVQSKPLLLHHQGPSPPGATSWVSLLCPTRQFSLQNTSLLMSSTALHSSVALLLFCLTPNSGSCKPRPSWSLPTS